MKINCTQENLNHGLAIVSHIANKNTSLPILNNVLISAKNSVITLSTTNLEMGVQCVVRGKVENEGAYTVQSKLLYDYVNLLTNDIVKVELSDDILNIASGKSHTKIKGNSAEEFPVIPEIKKSNPITVNVDDFISGLSQVIFATALSETRPEISGIYCNFSGKELTLAATDSYRLAEKVVTVTSGGTDKEVIIPARTMQELHRILNSLKGKDVLDGDDAESVLEIYFEENQVLFVYGTTELVSRLIEGQYPNYKQIIPTNYKTKGIVPVDALLKATKTASLFSRTGVFDVCLEFKKGVFTVSSVNNQLGENKSEIGGQIAGDDNTIIVNYRYLIDGLQNIDSTDVIIEMIDGVNPCVLKPAESLEDNKEAVTSGNYLYIIMPIKQ